MLRAKYGMKSFYVFILFIGLLIISIAVEAEAKPPKFDGFQEGSWIGDETTLEIKIARGEPSQTVKIVWENPEGTVIADTIVALDEQGKASFDWLIPVGCQDGDCDRLRLYTRDFDEDLGRYIYNEVDWDRGEWVAGGRNMPGRGKHATEIPTLTQWGLIILVGLIVASGLWLWRRKRARLAS
jgi:hypothetical protein